MLSLKECKDACVKHGLDRLRSFKDAPVGSLRASDDSVHSIFSQKRRALQSVPFKILSPIGRADGEGGVVDFPIKQLAVNPNDDLMAVVGEHDVAVVSLPRPAMLRAASTGGGKFRRVVVVANTSVDGESTTTRSIDVPVLECRVLQLEGGEKGDADSGSSESSSSIYSVTRSNKSSTRNPRVLLGPGDGGVFGQRPSLQGAWSRDRYSSKVAKVLWHPMSTKGAHLLVLYRDSVIKMFNVAQSIDVPEQIFNLKRAIKTGSVYGASEAVSFAFGYGEGWSRVTLYVITNWGDIYAVCPIIPGVWSAEHEWLEMLYKQVKIDLREYQGEEYHTGQRMMASQELTNTQRREEWLRTVLLHGRNLGSIVAIDMFTKDLKTRAILLRQPLIQGPFLLQPEPPETSIDDDDSDSHSVSSSADSSSVDDYGNAYGIARSGPLGGSDRPPARNKLIGENVSDIVYLPTLPVGILGVSYNNGRIDLFGDVDPIAAVWVGDALKTSGMYSGRQQQQYCLPILVTLETIEVWDDPSTPVAMLQHRARTSAGEHGSRGGKGHYQTPGSFSLDPTYPHVALFAHERGVFTIDVKAWVSYFEAELQRPHLSDQFGSTDEQPTPPTNSEVKCIVNMRVSGSSGAGAAAKRWVGPVVGVAVVDDIYLSRSMLVLAEPLQCVSVAAPYFDSQAATDASAGGSSRPGTGHGQAEEQPRDEPTAKYVPQLPDAPYAPSSSLLSKITACIQSRSVVFPSSLGIKDMGEDDLRELCKKAKEVHESIRSLAAATDDMNKRIEMQRKEHEFQKAKLSEIAGIINEKLAPNLSHSIDRLGKLKETQRAIRLRADELIRESIDRCQLPLSQHEKQFIKFVRDLDSKVDGPNGCQEQLDELSLLFKRLLAESATLHRRAEKQWGRTYSPSSPVADIGARSPSAQHHSMGPQQLWAIEQALDSEQVLLNNAIDLINRLNQKFARIANGSP
ncbi:hypothetical protein EV182_002161, partial [Spiromyces aspiralis]